MLEHRVMPILTIKNNGLYRTVKYRKPKYIGDPINAVKIFNDKEVDELILLDISEDRKWDNEKVKYYREISEEAFMPLCFGGRISRIDHAKRIFDSGFEKVSLNSSAVENPQLISEIANHYGVQSVVVSIDININIFGSARVYTDLGRKRTHLRAIDFAKQAESMGAG
ncbi:MAG TPA: imidazole glycerol phosphate synthase subunit HisF, partial [Ignavibacteria bacterium]|nr:imidazole glycerol phosphate synthase subunit HisF [Ignavibacteria bacterium]